MITPEQDRAYHRAYYRAHREEVLARTSAYAKAHKEQENARRRAYRSIPENAQKINATRRAYRKHSTKWLEAHRLNTYGITNSVFDTLLKQQGGVCAICKTNNWGKRGPHIDHDHNAGAVRGVLCAKCNLAVGLINDDANVAGNMATYLAHHANLAIQANEKGE